MTLKWKIAQALEIRWWRRYLKEKPISDYLQSKQAYWNRVLKTLQIEIRTEARILDAGCGPAGIFMILDEYEVDAVDPLLEEYERNLLHFKKTAYPNVHFYNQSLENFQIQPEYDIVFCMNAINHVADINLCLNKLVGAMAPNGQLILAVDVHKNSILKSIFRAIPGDVLHPQQHNLSDYKNMLAKRGCKIVKTIHLKSGRIFNYIAMIIHLADEKNDI